MKNFNKKAIFAALMGVLSPFSTFAMEKSTTQAPHTDKKHKRAKSQPTKKQTGHLSFLSPTDKKYKRAKSQSTKKQMGHLSFLSPTDKEHKRAKSQPTKKQMGHLSFLSPDDPYLVKKVNEINKIYLNTFADDPSTKRNRNINLLSKRELMKRIINSISNNATININKLRDLQKWPAQYGIKKGTSVNRTTYLNPGYDLDDRFAEQKFLDSFSKFSYSHDNVLSGIKQGTRCFLIYTNDADEVVGYIEFKYTDTNKKNIYIDWLANDVDKNNQGIGGAMLKFMQSKFDKIELSPATDAIGFYERFGFKYKMKEDRSYDKSHMEWNKKIKP